MKYSHSSKPKEIYIFIGHPEKFKILSSCSRKNRGCGGVAGGEPPATINRGVLY
jgi:hypothetical protein